MHTESDQTSINTNTLKELINSRRSHYPRQFSGETISDEVVEEILNLANTAPNHKRTQPWRFRVYSGMAKDAMVDFMKEFYLASTPVDNQKAEKIKSFDIRREKTSHIVAISAMIEEGTGVPEIEEISAVSCAVQNIYLSLESYGIGGYWSTGKITYSQEVRKKLDLDDKEVFMGFFYLGGIGIHVPVTEKVPLGDRVKWFKN